MKKLFLIMLALCLTLVACKPPEREYVSKVDAFLVDNDSKDDFYGFYADAYGNPINGKVRSTTANKANDNITIVRTVKNGFVEGTTNIYKNGNIFWRIDMKNGLPHGKVIGYYDDGHEHSYDTYNNGFLDGFSKYYNEDGSLYYLVWTDKGEYILGAFFQDGIKFFSDKAEAEWKDINKKGLVKDE
jgi:antitoxin component YwqK of YwqJK toxin-antitoxin module